MYSHVIGTVENGIGYNLVVCINQYCTLNSIDIWSSRLSFKYKKSETFIKIIIYDVNQVNIIKIKSIMWDYILVHNSIRCGSKISQTNDVPSKMYVILNIIILINSIKIILFSLLFHTAFKGYY